MKTHRLIAMARAPLAILLSIFLLCFATACTSEPSPEAYQVQVEILSGPAPLTNQTTADFELTCNLVGGCNYQCSLDGQEYLPCQSSPRFENLRHGDHRFYALAVDGNGPISPPASWEWTVDTQSPRLISLTGPQRYTDVETATFGFGCSKPDCLFHCALNGEESQLCEPGVAFGPLSDGDYVLSIQAEDQAGNRSKEHLWRWTVDGAPPLVLDLLGPPERTNQTSVEFSFRCSKDHCSYHCGLNSAPTTPCEPGVSFEGLSDGTHVFAVRATDYFGTPGPQVAWSWQVDTELPQVLNLQGPPALTNQTEAAFSFACSKPNCQFSCSLLSSAGTTLAAGDCASGIAYDTLPDDSFTFSVFATDTLGNQGPPAQWEWAVDTEPPHIVDLQGPEAETRQSTAAFSFSCTKPPCEYQCSLSALSQGTVLAPISCDEAHLFEDLADDEYHFSVTATDELGNEGEPALWSWVVDSEVPLIVNLDGPDAVTNEPEATFSFACTKADCSYACALFAQTEVLFDEVACDTAITFPLADDAEYTFEVFATDELGNVGPRASWSWQLDREEPEVTILSGPADPSDSMLAGFDFECSKAGCQTYCALDAASQGSPGPFVACNSGHVYDALLEDDYTFAVFAVDAVGNQGPTTTWSWTVALEDPEVVFTQTPPATTQFRTAHFAFHCTNKDWCGFECALDTHGEPGTFEACTSPWTLDALSPGTYVFRVRATDAAGKEGHAEYQWAIAEREWAFISAGFGAACAIDTDGGLWCWGHNERGRLGLGDFEHRAEPTAVDVPGTWTQVDVGGAHTCGIQDDGSLWCWGHSHHGRLGIGFSQGHQEPVQVGSDTNWRQVVAASEHTCAIRTDDTLWCWGYGHRGRLGLGTVTTHHVPMQVGSADNWRQVSALHDHTCATRTDDTLWCWGSNSQGRLGLDVSYYTTPYYAEPTQVAPDTAWRQVAASADQTCAVATDDRLFCWGWNNSGRLGLGTEPPVVAAPTQVGDENVWQYVSPGGAHGCALRTDTTLWCWGLGSFGRTALGHLETTYAPEQVGSEDGWEMVSGGTCALRADNTLWCWGNNRYGAVGFGLFGENKLEPVLLDTTDTVVQISGGGGFGCALFDDDSTRCWGGNWVGQLGLDDNVDRISPVTVPDFTNLAQISTGHEHSCAIKDDGSLWCWGRGANGRLGLGDTDHRFLPSRVGDAYDWAFVSAGSLHTCAIKDDSSLWCWGLNAGRLGLGDSASRDVPTRVGTDDDWISVKARNGHTCGLRNDGTIWCWGYNSSGQLGLGDTDTRYVPTQVGTDTDWTLVTLGDGSSCALKSDHTLWCWGFHGGSGMLGLGESDTTIFPTPTMVDLPGWDTVTKGGRHACGIRLDGTLWCWGSGTRGALGLGDTDRRKAPTQVGSANDWTGLSLGTNATFAFRSSGVAWVWGRNADGHLGDGTPWKAVPTAVAE